MSDTNHRPLIRDALASGEFLYTLEQLPAVRGEGDADNLAALAREARRVGEDPRIKGVNIGDRVKSLDSIDTVTCGQIAAEASGKTPLLHLAGKNREPDEAVQVYEQALAQGLKQLLIITGDGIPVSDGAPRPRYFDSANGIAAAKALDPDVLVAAAVSPFKYFEEELLNQYLKMAKKYLAGADYLITNCGWDMRKFEELVWYREARGFDIPLVANLLLPTRAWARGIHKRRLPGVYLSDDLMSRIEAEYADQKGGRAHGMHRLALQIVGVRHLGYAGVQLSGVDTYEDLCEAIEMADALGRQYPDLGQWREAWRDLHRTQDGRDAEFGPAGGIYLFGDEPPAKGSLSGPPVIDGVTASPSELRSAGMLDGIDRTFFREGAAGAKLMRPLCRAFDGPVLRWAEHAIKKPLLGCEMCGFCRIPYLSYVCPETCPKGLANGPCSGTDDNVCEFKDRECIHNRKYRVAKAQGRLAELETLLVPPVRGTRGTSSWANKYRGADPEVIRLKNRGPGESSS